MHNLEPVFLLSTDKELAHCPGKMVTQWHCFLAGIGARSADAKGMRATKTKKEMTRQTSAEEALKRIFRPK